MADQSTVLRVRAEVENLEGLNRLRTAVRGVSSEAKASSNDFNKLLDSVRSLDTATNRSINGLQRQKEAFDAIRRSANLGSDAFKQASAEIARLDKQLAQVEGKQAGGRGAKLAQTLGAVASGGVFGGPEGLIGGAIGAAGGPTGALAGAALGAQIGQLRQLAGSTAEYAAEINKQRIALQLVTKDQNEYQRALQFIDRTSRQLAIPQEIITEQFTKLTASVKGAGGNVRDAEKAFIGIASGIRGTGGSLQQLESALLATSQVFSKGKVSAEELRQQIGERLPGAFSLFAKSLDMTPQELDKALEKGQVSLQDFQKFAEKLFEEYGENAKIIANGPDAAGDRLKTSLSRLNESIGTLLKPIGAEFQTVFAKIAVSIDEAARKLADFLGIGKGSADEIRKLKNDIETTNIRLQDFARLRVRRGGMLDPGQYSQEKTLLERSTRLRSQLSALEAAAKIAREGQTEPPSKLPGIDPTAAKEKKPPRIPVQRISDIIGASEKQAEQAEKNLRLQELINEAKQKGFKYDAEILPLLRKSLDFNTQIQYGEAAIEELVGNKNYLLKNGLSIEEYTARLAVARTNIETARINRQTEFLQLQDKEREIVERIDADRTNALQKIQQYLIDAEMASKKLTDEEKRRLEINQFLAKVIEESFGKISDEELVDAINRIREAMEKTIPKAKDFGENFKESFQQVATSALDLGTNIGASLGNAFSSLGDQIGEFVTTGKASFADLTRSVLADLAKIFARAAIFATLKSVFQGSSVGKLFGFAMGGVMTSDGPMPLKRYANGGIASSPQLAMFGEGSMPEAYVPLPDGRSIPVSMKNGGSGSNVVVNVDASGTSVQGNQPDAAALGRAIGAAVQAELVKQKRPGGLLA